MHPKLDIMTVLQLIFICSFLKAFRVLLSCAFWDNLVHLLCEHGIERNRSVFLSFLHINFVVFLFSSLGYLSNCSMIPRNNGSLRWQEEQGSWYEAGPLYKIRAVFLVRMYSQGCGSSQSTDHLLMMRYYTDKWTSRNPSASCCMLISFDISNPNFDFFWLSPGVDWLNFQILK